MVAVKSLGAIVVTNDSSLTLKNREHGESYHSLAGARTEARKLYIEGSGILLRLQTAGSGAIKVLDVGLGLAYNALATVEAWMQSPAPDDLHLTSLEIDRSLVDLIASGGAPWSSNWDDSWLRWSVQLAREGEMGFVAKLPHPNGRGICRWNIHLGDASQLEMLNCGHFDMGFEFIWQDPFSPKKNPQLWSKAWFVKLREVSSPQVSLMSYSVARMVCDNLLAAGWSFTKTKAMGAKRNWLRAYLSK